MRPMYCAKMRRGGDAADEEDGHVAVRGKQHVLGVGEQRGADRDGLLPAAHVDAAQDLALPVQLALDAVFHFAHQQHVVETLVRQFGWTAGFLLVVRSSGLGHAHQDPLAGISV